MAYNEISNQLYGGSSGLRFSLARRMSRRIRFPRPPPYKISIWFSSKATNAASSYGAYREFESHLNHQIMGDSYSEEYTRLRTLKQEFDSLIALHIYPDSSMAEQTTDNR